jgi:hypothetical protein
MDPILRMRMFSSVRVSCDVSRWVMARYYGNHVRDGGERVALQECLEEWLFLQCIEIIAKWGLFKTT